MFADVVIQAMPIFRELTNGTLIALGGYPSLVKQGILRDLRETKDVDICTFSTKDFNQFFVLGEIATTSCNTCRQWSAGLKATSSSTRFWTRMLDKSMSNDIANDTLDLSVEEVIRLRENINMQTDKIRATLGLQRSASLRITKDSLEKPGLDIDKSLGVFGDDIGDFGKSIGITKEPSQLQISLMERIYEEYPPINAEYAASFFDNQKFNNLDIDIFVFPFEKMDKMTVMIDGERFVHYYVILKAKYEYCLNKSTDQNAFDKHIGDLSESFRVKHIKGVNYPEDIEFLINNRNGKE